MLIVLIWYCNKILPSPRPGGFDTGQEEARRLPGSRESAAISRTSLYFERQVRTAGLGSELPAWSIANTVKVWSPFARLL